MLGLLNKLFGGTKSEKDVKKLQPIVDKINGHFDAYASLSNDELRGKTNEFKSRIASHLQEINDQINSKKETADAEVDVHQKDAFFKEIDELTKTRDEKLEEVLLEILPEAFATMKETARRFTENEEIRSSVMFNDEDFSVSKDYITIDNGEAVYRNSWDAAGAQITWNMIHYDVQLIGGYNLHQGKISEMATGEGKTLVSTLPSYLNGLSGLGVHLVSVNDYLAKRDSEWNAPLFEWLGLTVDCIDKHDPHSDARKEAYGADIVYGTNNEFGFDYLRDNMVQNPNEIVQGKLHYAMIDEVDSVLIDDARTPLIISGPVPKGDEQEFHALKPRIESLVNAQKKLVNGFLVDAKKRIAEGDEDKEGGGLALFRAVKGLPKNSSLIKFLSEPGMRQIYQKTENYYLGEQQKHMPEAVSELHFTIDEKNNQVDLTDKGLQALTKGGEDANFFVLPDIATELTRIENSSKLDEEKAKEKDALLQDYSVKTERIHTLQQLLKAYTLFEKDVEYVVMEGKVKIVDEQTGRIMDGRRYSDGLHQAIEAKENVDVEAATQTFATVTLQNFFRMYHKLCGMTGTAETEAAELYEIYKLDVTSIPTNLPIIRDDRDDKVYKTKREKYRAVIEEIVNLSNNGQPVLVGTTNVEVSELLSRMLKQAKIKHNVLNAKQHGREAQVVAEAGIAGNVTIATNMAGRGTDIKLGPGVKEAGGLAIVGTERHESRRVDRQLRGRAGRQGDPGSSQFFVSLEDDLMRLFGSERLSNVMDKLGHKEGDMIQHGMISKSIERAQKKVEENNFGIRKRLLEYDDVMNSQREVIYARRKNALFGERLAIDLDNAFYDSCQVMASQFSDSKDFEFFKLQIAKELAIDTDITKEEFGKMNQDALTDRLYNDLLNAYERKKQALKENVLPVLKNMQIRNSNIDRVAIPFTDGNKGMQVVVQLEEAIQSEGGALLNAVEKQITLGLIDEGWKVHLRQMDETKTSVQMASYEQKDPLLIYKFEAFELFKTMINDTNKSIVSFLSKAGIPADEEQDVKAAREQKTDMSKMQSNKAAVDAAGDDYAANENDYYDPTPQKQEPVRREEPKVGRNEPCPCGTGKKYKHCHGKK
jgi:preprotein translocase subunit SecA